MLAIFILFASLSACVAEVEEIGLGQSLYIPDTNLLGSTPDGAHIFYPFDKECIRKVPLDVSDRHDAYYRDTASFYSSIAVSTNLRGSYEADFTMAATLDATTKSISSSERTVSGDSMKLASKAYKELVVANCIHEGKLKNSLVTDFRNLGINISEPWQFESWRSYKIFLKKYGSHLVTEVIYGSSINQYSFSKSEKKYTERDFTVKSCVSLAGDVGVKKLNVSLCAGITSEEIAKVSSLEIVSTLTVRGGSVATRSALLNERTNDLIQKFLNEGYTSPAAVQFKLKPIWEVLQEKYSSIDDLAKAINLEYFYKGYLNFHCPYIAQSGQALQRFELASNNNPAWPEYQCSLAPDGCHSYDDCHYLVGVTCGCYGSTCIRYDSETLDTGKTRTTAAPYSGHYWNWQGCDWKVWGSVCSCQHERTERKVIWSLDSKRALYLNSMACADKPAKMRKLKDPKNVRGKKEQKEKMIGN